MRAFCDIHCHLVPGVDDGAKNLDMSLSVLKTEYADGVRAIILTPHYRRGMFETRRERVHEQYELLKATAKQQFPDLELYLGCEYHASHEMVDRLRESAYYRMGGSYYALVEFSESHEAKYMQHRINEVLQAGFQPIIAHIERYPACTADLDLIRYFKDAGCLIQVNADSVIGKDGFWTKRFVKKMLNERLVDLIGTDAHNNGSRAPHIRECVDYLDRTYGTDFTDQLMWENPRAIMKSIDEMPPEGSAIKVEEPAPVKDKMASVRKKVVIKEINL